MIKDKYIIAEKEAVKYVIDNFPKVTSIIIGGSVVRKEGDINSDLDIYVIHTDNFRKRVFKKFNEVPCDFFVNNLSHIDNYFKEEYNKNRPVTADIISTGKVVYGNETPEIQSLVEKAKVLAGTGYVASKKELNLKKIELMTILEDINDIFQKDYETTCYLMQNLITKAVELSFLKARTPLPRIKKRLKDLLFIQPEIGSKIKEFYRNHDLLIKVRISEQIVNILLDENNNPKLWDYTEDL